MSALRKPLNSAVRLALRGVLEANGFTPCTHPDCDPRQPSCASNHIFTKAVYAVEAAYRLGRGEKAFTREGASR